jgi:hypothetical protein
VREKARKDRRAKFISLLHHEGWPGFRRKWPNLGASRQKIEQNFTPKSYTTRTMYFTVYQRLM